MFRESLLETSNDMRARRGWATMASFALEAAFVVVLILIPHIYTDALPRLHVSDTVPPPPGAPPAARVPGRVTKLAPIPAELGTKRLEAPRWIPAGVARGPEPPAQPAGNESEYECVGCVPFGVPDGDPNARNTSTLLTRLLGPEPKTPPPPHLETRRSVMRISHIDPGMLIVRVEPKYPGLALQTRTQGEVLLAAIIGRNGQIENLHVISGHPLLIPAAMDAVRQWRYRPFLLNGQPVEVETQIAVRFHLDH